ncbi:hypothetical protein CupriaWKF_07260 [Cupriavidus sp. WKF15]|uniref:hypothetical protein n=1 Tax=Cupriavidus sp. WKF15 TaxID=3032282 RepID=UPI0023E29FFA|nr:hypothetical protein [Cupriavidus sp. WKF15]WER47338.1 hypothetical protein CupriaWKF_07260 [Cupriavidus sp. WKF15]
MHTDLSRRSAQALNREYGDKLMHLCAYACLACAIFLASFRAIITLLSVAMLGKPGRSYPGLLSIPLVQLCGSAHGPDGSVSRHCLARTGQRIRKRNGA